MEKKPTANVAAEPSSESGSGLMAARVRSFDWSRTPIGPFENWPECLRVAVDLCLSGRFPMHVWWGPELIYIYNDAHIPVLGNRHPDALGQPAADVWAEVWPLLAPQVEAVMQRGESTWNERASVVLERRGFREDAWFTWSYSPIRDVAGRIAGLMCIATEDTARVLAERDQLEKQATLAAIVESSDDAIIGKTLEGIISTWNGGAERIFGYTAGEVIGRHILMLIPPERHHEEADIQDRLTQGHRIEHFETVRVAKHGRMIDVSLTVSPVKNSAGKIVGASKIVRDISARKRAEESLSRQATELARSNMELERFAYVAAHDLQEPLRSVHGFAQLLERRCAGNLPPDAGEFLGFIIAGVQRMQTLINDLLVYSRVSSHRAVFAQVDCQEILKTTLENLRSTIESTEARITSDSLPVVFGDSTQLGQMFQNLLANALKFHGTRTPEIHVSVRQAGDDWVFSVKDNGIGIATEYFERIFVIFQRLHTIEEYGGTGIGLAVCRRIAERHGGRIWVESVPRQGSIFYFSIPKKGNQTYVIKPMRGGVGT